MKRLFKYFIVMFLIVPFIKVNAISCYDETIDVKDGSFSCSGVKGNKLQFKGEDGKDYKDKFTYEIKGNGDATIFPDSGLTFSVTEKTAIINIADETSSTSVIIKNNAYVEPTTTKAPETTSTTTTKDPNVKEVTVTLDPNNGEEKVIKTCKIVAANTYCSVTLPKLETEGFNGWGTAKTCKEGKLGSEKVQSDVTYYACNKNNTNESTTDGKKGEIYLKTLKLFDKDTEEEIKFGTFSIKKLEYDFKVLYEVENIDIKTTQDDSVKVDISGNEKLKVGENKIIIKLTNDKDETNEYVLTVNRLKEGEEIVNVNYLKSLVVGGYQINFDKNKFVYSLTIPSDVNELQIDAISENNEIKPVIKGNSNLVNGSQIMIELGDDENKTVYYINITKENKSNMLLFIALGAIALLIIVLVILIVIKSKNKKSGASSKKSNNQKSDIEVLNI